MSISCGTYKSALIILAINGLKTCGSCSIWPIWTVKNLLEQGIDSFDEVTEAEFYFKLDQALSLGYQEWQQPGNSYYALMEHTLIKRIVTYTPQYFAWVTNFALPFSNNLSERSLRGVKSKMKVAGQFENITSSKNYATIRSYIKTSYRNEKNPTKA